jgi:hypothetical protein
MVWILIILIVFILVSSLIILYREKGEIIRAAELYDFALKSFSLDPTNEKNKDELIKTGKKYANLAKKKARKGDALIFDENRLQEDIARCINEYEQSFIQEFEPTLSERVLQRKMTVPFQRDIYFQTGGTKEERIRKLEEMLRAGFIGEKEFEEKKEKIMSEE